MGKKCKKCSGSVSGIEQVPYVLILGGIGASIAADKVNKMLTVNADGTPKTGYLAENPKIKDVVMLAGGAAIAAYADGNEMVTGLGIGVAVYAGYSLVNSLMTPATTSGMGYIPPAQLGAIHVPGNAGYSPSNIGNYNRTHIPYTQPQQQQQTRKVRAV